MQRGSTIPFFKKINRFSFGQSTLILALFLTLLLSVTGIALTIDQSGKSIRNNILNKSASKDVVIVEMDSRSLREIGQWPWPRETHATLINKLSQNKASQIAFDIDFSSASNDKSDKALSDAIANSQATVLLATFKQRESDNSDILIENAPLPIFSENAFLGSVNVIPNDLGYISDYEYAEKINGSIRPTLAALLTSKSAKIGEKFEIDQAINPETIPRISAIDIINDNFNSADINGKTMIIGGTAIELGDRYATAAHGVIPGVIIHALAAETIKSGMDIPSLSAIYPLILAITLVLLLNHFLRSKKVKFRMAISAVLIMSMLLKFFAYKASIMNLDMGLTIGFLICYIVINISMDTLKSLYIERMYDSATQLPNSQSMIIKMRKKSEIHIAVAQIGNFSEIKSVCTDDELNKVIQSIAERLKLLAVSKKIFRTGTDQLAWVIDSESNEHIQDHFDTVSALLLSPVKGGDQTFKLNVNCGYIKGAGSDCLTLLSKASIAATKAASYGSNWMPYDDDINIIAKEKLTILSSVDDAIGNGDIWVAYQPKIEVATGVVSSAEALARWYHSELGNIGPDRFIPILEAQGRITELTIHILRQCLSDLQIWSKEGPAFNCSINVSAALLLNNDFINDCINIINESAVDNGQITLEITETSALESLSLASKALQNIKSFGIGISIDDYGTGQSTLSYLRDFSADEIKIDQSFISKMTVNDTDRVMVGSTIDLAHSMGFKVVAEGVEDQATFDILKSFRCDIIQGWYIGKPINAAAFANLWVNKSIKKSA